MSLPTLGEIDFWYRPEPGGGARIDRYRKAQQRVIAAAQAVAAIDWENVRVWIPDVALPLDELRSALAGLDKLSKS